MRALLSRRHSEAVRIVVHGGAGRISEDETKFYAEGVRKAAEVGLGILKSGGSAIDAVEEAVAYMEDDPTFNAGKGSVLNCEGFVELDAIIMDGATLRVGAVAAVKRVKNPIKLARAIMERTKHNMFVGEWADKLAEVLGLELVEQSYFFTERRRREWEEMNIKGANSMKDFLYSTVGAVAVDTKGNVAAATSTGGTPFKMPGRVGDTPLVGSGAYADNLLGAASATGLGEAIMKVVLSKTALDMIHKEGDPKRAVERAIKLMEERVGGSAGLIMIDPLGNVGIAHNTPEMAFAFNKENSIVFGVRIEERKLVSRTTDHS